MQKMGMPPGLVFYVGHKYGDAMNNTRANQLIDEKMKGAVKRTESMISVNPVMTVQAMKMASELQASLDSNFSSRAKKLIDIRISGNG